MRKSVLVTCTTAAAMVERTELCNEVSALLSESVMSVTMDSCSSLRLTFSLTSTSFMFAAVSMAAYWRGSRPPKRSSKGCLARFCPQRVLAKLEHAVEGQHRIALHLEPHVLSPTVNKKDHMSYLHSVKAKDDTLFLIA